MPRLITTLLFASLFAASSLAAPQAPEKQTPRETPKEQSEKPAPKKDAKKETEKVEPKKDVKKDDAKKDGDGIKTREAKKSEIEIPEGANEEDIRAIRGANAMLETERKLGAILKKMKVAKDTPFIKFDRLDSWPYEDGYEGMPKDLRKLDGKKVAMAGFMLPIDEVEDIKTFYLVKSLWSCCYGIPPDVNGLVKINVKAKKGIGYQWDPILVVGTFRLKKVMDDDYTICIWQMDDVDVRVIEVD